MAKVEAAGFVIRRGRSFADLEKKAPALVAEMRQDLTKNPLVREFIILSKKVTYMGSGKLIFMYFLEEHENLRGIVDVMLNYGAIFDVSFNKVPRYN
ncbi:hypothetical protein EN805_34330, partial [bacterium M00.F.Ca.ET.162.01.1.1]